MIFNRLVLLVVLTEITAGVSASGIDAGGLPVLALRPSVQADSAGVFLHQVLAESPPGITNCLVAQAPAPNQAVVVSRAQVTHALEKQCSGVAFTNWTGAATLKVTRRLRQFEEAELKDLLTATLQQEQARDRGELELRLNRTWAPISVPDEPLSLKVLELPVSGLSPNFIVRFELRTERETLGTWQMPLQAKLWSEVWVAHSPQPRGRILSDADLGRERRDLLTLRDAWFRPDYADSSLEFAENIPMGMPVLQRSVRPRPVVHRGKTLEAMIQEGTLLITVKVEAMEDGLPGQLIRVRNSKSKREFHAKVQNEQTVVVKL